MWTVWPILIFLYHIVFSANNVFTCRSNTDCTHDHICQSNICKKCIKCEWLFRKGNDRACDFKDCGPCIAGYQEISVTNFSNVVKPCVAEKSNSFICSNDEDCPVGNYCNEKFCAVCFDCTLLNKLPPSSGCAKDFNMCGFCIDGFYELPVTTNSNLKPCGRRTSDLNKFPKLVLSISNVLPFCILVVFAAVVIKSIIRKHKVCLTARNDTKVASCERPLSPSAPPLFVLDIPETVQCKNEKCSTVTLATELKQQANMARVFKQPQALYYFAEESPDDASDHSNDSNEEDSGAPQRSDTEETSCSWTVFIHRYAEVRDHFPFSQEVVNGSLNGDMQFNNSVNNIDSASGSELLAENTTTSVPQIEDSNSSKS